MLGPLTQEEKNSAEYMLENYGNMSLMRASWMGHDVAVLCVYKSDLEGITLWPQFIVITDEIFHELIPAGEES